MLTLSNPTRTNPSTIAGSGYLCVPPPAERGAPSWKSDGSGKKGRTAPRAEAVLKEEGKLTSPNDRFLGSPLSVDQ